MRKQNGKRDKIIWYGRTKAKRVPHFLRGKYFYELLYVIRHYANEVSIGILENCVSTPRLG